MVDILLGAAYGLVKQSLPFSYVFVEAASVDGAKHSVQLYSDINAGEREASLELFCDYAYIAARMVIGCRREHHEVDDTHHSEQHIP